MEVYWISIRLDCAYFSSNSNTSVELCSHSCYPSTPFFDGCIIVCTMHCFLDVIGPRERFNIPYVFAQELAFQERIFDARPRYLLQESLAVTFQKFATVEKTSMSKNCCTGLLFFAGITFFFLMLVGTPFVLLLLEILRVPLLWPAKCEIERVFSNNRYKVLVIPQDEDRLPFETTAKANKPGFSNLDKGQNVTCWYRTQCSKHRTCSTNLQFHSRRKDPSVASLVIYSIWLGVGLLFSSCMIWVTCFHLRW